MPELSAAKKARIDEVLRCRPGETALLVIDMQRGFLEPSAALEVPAGREIIPQFARLVALCRAKGVPVIFTQMIYQTAVPSLRGDPFGLEHLAAVPGQPTGFGHPSSNTLVGPEQVDGADSPDIIEELRPRPEELIVPAHTYDKFYGTPLDLALRTMGVRYLVAGGVITEICVNATLIAASIREYRVTAVSDAVASTSPELHEACLKLWEKKYARLRTTEEVAAEIGGW